MFSISLTRSLVVFSESSFAHDSMSIPCDIRSENSFVRQALADPFPPCAASWHLSHNQKQFWTQ